MSIVQKSPLFDYSNFTNTAFSVTYVGTFFKVAFAAPISQTYYLNRELYNVKYSDLGANYVDLGEFDWGILTVDYTRCTAPVAGSRNAWIDAVNALITNPASTITLGARSRTDSAVGYNSATQQLTDWGPLDQRCFFAYKTTAQNNVAGGTLVLFNVVVDDPLSMYNPATGIMTLPATGYWLFGYTVYFGTFVNNVTCLFYNGAELDGYAISNTDSNHNTVGRYLAAGTTVAVLMRSNTSAVVNLNQINNFWAKQVF